MVQPGRCPEGLLMAARPVWKGFIRFSLVSVPVKAYTATASGSNGISLNQLHRECHSRINYRKTCPQHGELKSEEIVSGYEYSKDQYVIIDPDELEKVRSTKDRAIDISAFIKPDSLDPAYYSGKTYYLVPDGPMGAKPYSILHGALVEQNRYGFAQVVFTGKEQVVLLRPIGGLLAMTPLCYDQDVRKPAEFEPEAPKVEVTPDEMKLARQLTEAMAKDDFDFSEYKDLYQERLQKLIEAKIEGKEVVAAPSEQAPQVINLMEALKKSVAEAKAAASAKPAKAAAASSAGKEKAARQRKTS